MPENKKIYEKILKVAEAIKEDGIKKEKKDGEKFARLNSNNIKDIVMPLMKENKLIYTYKYSYTSVWDDTNILIACPSVLLLDEPKFVIFRLIDVETGDTLDYPSTFKTHEIINKDGQVASIPGQQMQSAWTYAHQQFFIAAFQLIIEVDSEQPAERKPLTDDELTRLFAATTDAKALVIEAIQPQSAKFDENEATKTGLKWYGNNTLQYGYLAKSVDDLNKIKNIKGVYISKYTPTVSKMEQVKPVEAKPLSFTEIVASADKDKLNELYAITNVNLDNGVWSQEQINTAFKLIKERANELNLKLENNKYV